MQVAAEKVISATLIAGDGIGPEIVEATVMVLDALHAPFAWEVHKAGMSGLEALGDPLPQSTVDSIRRTRLALKGPLTHAGRRWLPLLDRAIARGVSSVGQRASRPHPDAGRALRRYRSS